MIRFAAYDASSNDVLTPEKGLAFLKPFECSDITLMVEGTPVYAVKSVLSLWSPVFRAMFTGDFKEKEQSSIELPDKDLFAVAELMQFLHPPHNTEAQLTGKE